MSSSEAAKPYVGGQAVLEGVMMRSPRCLAVAVRRPDGSIVVREDAWISIFERLKFLRWPGFRGAVILVESLYNGIQALNFSAEHAGLDEEQPRTRKKGGAANVTPLTQNAQAPGAPGTPAAVKEPSPTDGSRSNAAIAATIALSFVIALGLFVGLPHLLAWGAGQLATKDGLGVETFGFHALDGLFKIAIFVGYIGGISLIPEIRRVFQYHGAEHKAINTYESGEELTVDNAMRRPTFHPRCGTSFILFVLILSIFLFAAIFPMIPRVAANDFLNHLAMIGIKIPLMLPLAGIAYEINKYASKHPNQLWVQGLVVPGRLMQQLTTKEPTADQLEIALSAMRAALRREAELAAIDVKEAARIKAAQPAGGVVTVFQDFGEVARAIPVAAAQTAA